MRDADCEAGVTRGDIFAGVALTLVCAASVWVVRDCKANIVQLNVQMEREQLRCLHSHCAHGVPVPGLTGLAVTCECKDNQPVPP